MGWWIRDRMKWDEKIGTHGMGWDRKPDKERNGLGLERMGYWSSGYYSGLGLDNSALCLLLLGFVLLPLWTHRALGGLELPPNEFRFGLRVYGRTGMGPSHRLHTSSVTSFLLFLLMTWVIWYVLPLGAKVSHTPKDLQ